MAITRAKSQATRLKKAQAPFRILDLPPEIVGDICDQLDDGSLINVRQACRALNVHSTVAFGTRFFGHVITVLHPLSLTELLELANHPKLSKFIRKLTISAEHLRSDLEDLQTLKAVETSMEKSGTDRLILDKVVLKLGNLETIKVGNGSFELEFLTCADIRCGWRHFPVALALDIDFVFDSESQHNFRRVSGIVFDSIARAKICEKLKLEICFSFDEEPTPQTEPFDLNNQRWRKHFAENVRRVKFFGGYLSTWVPKFLSSTSQLQDIYVYGSNKRIHFSDPR